MHARRIRILAISVLVLSVYSASRMSAQDACSVKEQRRVDTVTGKFLLQETAVSLTLPKFLHPLDPVAVRLEVSGSSEAGAVLRFASEIAPLRDGARLQATLRLNERFIFSVHAGDGRKLCSWEPAIIVQRRTYRSAKGPLHWEEGYLRITDEPILLSFAHEIGRDAPEFRLGGLPTTVLAENRRQVILRDPRPEAGERTLETPNGKVIWLRFCKVTMGIGPASKSQRFIVHATDVKLRRPAGLMVYNFSPQPAKLKCGRRMSRIYGEIGSRTYVLMLPVQSQITASCEVTPPYGMPVELNDMAVQLLDVFSWLVRPGWPVRFGSGLE